MVFLVNLNDVDHAAQTEHTHNRTAASTLQHKGTGHRTNKLPTRMNIYNTEEAEERQCEILWIENECEKSKLYCMINSGASLYPLFLCALFPFRDGRPTTKNAIWPCDVMDEKCTTIWPVKLVILVASGAFSSLIARTIVNANSLVCCRQPLAIILCTETILNGFVWAHFCFVENRKQIRFAVKCFNLKLCTICSRA